MLTMGTACGSDHGINGMCGTPQQGFDITEASELQDAQGYWGMHDAVILDFDDSGISADANWRARSVEIMPMIGVSEFDWFADGQQISVEIWDADNPLGTPWTVTQTFHKDEHEWEAVTLSDPTTAWEPNQMMTWWRFGFEDVIPTSGMTDGRYLVSVVWESDALPTLGYSNFNRDCGLNWTDYADGLGWKLNESGMGCSWPMLRVNMEVLEEAAECEGESYNFE